MGSHAGTVAVLRRLRVHRDFMPPMRGGTRIRVMTVALGRGKFSDKPNGKRVIPRRFF